MCKSPSDQTGKPAGRDHAGSLSLSRWSEVIQTRLGSTGMSADLVQELNVAIAETRGGHESGKIAGRVLSNDASGTFLLGVFDDGRIITWDPTNWSICAIDPPTDDGLHLGKHAIQLDKAQDIHQAEVWVAGRRGDFHWLHPRFRWLKDVEQPHGTPPDAEPV